MTKLRKNFISQKYIPINNYFNVVELNASTKRWSLADKQIHAPKTNNSSLCCLILTSDPNTHTDRKWRNGKDIPCKWKWGKKGVAILLSDKMDFKIKTVTISRKGHCIMTKWSIQLQDAAVANMYALNRRTP